MENDYFYTIQQLSTGIYKEKGSKFLSFAYPVENEEKIKKIIEYTKNKYHDARHHCFAYVLGKDKKLVRANDAGEPSNSAGKPILNQITKKDLTDLLIIVVRYFGGKLLGVNGLVNAYRTAAAKAIEQATIIKKYILAHYVVNFDYDNINYVMKILDKPEVNQTDHHFEKKCTIHFSIRKSLADQAINELKILPGIKLDHLSY